ncbi:MAG: GTPase [Clostridia bacterium]|nr:GTPase [Clostridia bacterium]
MEIPVYLFLGFLESGKTKFIQESFEDPRFDTGERTLILQCEEGIEELDFSRFKVKKVDLHPINDVSELTPDNLKVLQKQYKARRIIVEYNGMWEIGTFFDAMPEEWVVAQIMTFVDSSTFLMYNQNMRQLVFDKISVSELVVFNRFPRGGDKTPYHKVVRAITRMCDIAYEYPDGAAEMDDIEDPLPYDMESDPIEIEDRDFAYFYRDLVENTDNYVGKNVRFLCMTAVDGRLPDGVMVVGRHIMTCCEADTTYRGLVAKYTPIRKYGNNEWLRLTAEIKKEYNKLYKSVGPVFYVKNVEQTEEPQDLIVTFY